MKRRLLAFFLAFAMMVSLMPVSAFAVEEEPTPPFTGIVTDSGEEATAQYVKTVVGEAAWGDAINAPYYHVTIPEGTENVLVTYPKDTAFVFDGSDESNALFYYMNTYPGQSEIGYGGTLPITVNDDGSKSVVIPVENFLLTDAGYSLAVGMAYQVDAENKSAIDFLDFTYAASAPVSHTVTLTAGEGYTLKGETTVEDGKDYSFTVSVVDDYEKTDAFAVKANGKALTANASGSYTVETVSGDLTITVEGVAKKQTEPEKTFTSILTNKDEEVTAEYVGMVPVELNGVTYADAPYYHVTIPAKTRTVYVTYPAGVEFDADGVAFTYALLVPSYTAKVGLVGLSITTKSDGSTTIGIPVEDFLLDDNGEGKAVSPKYSGSQDPIGFFSFSYDPQTVITHSVKLPTGEGYTLKGETTVEDGDDYTFTITIADGYEKTDSFAVKVNGNTVQPNANGNCTVKSVSTDLTVTVEGVAKKQEASTKRFTAIVTDDGKEVSAEFKGMIPVETYQTFNDGPYYHVTVPAGTKSVQVTYPASVNIAGGSAAYFYTLSVPDYTVGFGDGSFAVTTNDDGSKTMTIPVAPYLLDDSGKGTAASAEYSVSFDPITFFSFAYEGGAAVSYNVTLTAGEGYTLTGEATVEEGKDYTFTIAIAEGYEKTEAFAVKANGEVLAANADGSYTVKAVSADLTVTVEGVAEKQTELFSGIVTDSGKEVTVEYQGKVLAKNDYSSYKDVPYYHVTVPAGTASVQITYPASVNMMGVNSAYGYTLTIPGHVLDWTTDGFAFVKNSDGSKTVTIPVADYLLDADGKGTAVSVEYNSYAPIEFFTFAYEPAVTHKVYLRSGSGYTLTGQDTVEDGADYTFTLSIADGYGKADNFSVTANGVALTANEDGTYTVKNVTANLRISVNGVYAPYTVYLPESDGYVLSDYATGEVLSGSFKLAMTKSYKIKVTLKDGYAVRGNDYGVEFAAGMIANTETFDGYAVITIVTVTGDGSIAIEGVKKIVNVTLPEGEGYTVAPTEDTSNPVLSGDFYYFSVTVAEGYEKTEAFAVKANGKTLTANESGNYTAGNFGTDLTITVEGVSKKQTTPEAPFTSIVSDSDEVLTAEYVETVSAESAQDGTLTVPYYHVVVPEGTSYVMVTFPESAGLYQATMGNVYWFGMSLPEHTAGRGQAFPAELNDDGSITAIIYVSNFILNEDGSGSAVGMVSTDASGNFTTPNFFSFSYAAKPASSHAVTLTAGTGYTLTGESSVADGASYTFKLDISSGYGKSDAFAVKANGETLTANADGSYTVPNVTGDLTVTVKGVTQTHTITLPKSRTRYAITDYTSGEELGTELAIAEGQTYKFKITLKDGYAVRNKDFNIQFNSIYNVVKIEEDDASAIITMSKVVENDKMTIKGVKKVLNVTVPEGEGYTVVPDESKMTLPILSGEDYYFKVVIADGYAKSDDFAVQSVDKNGTRDLTEVDGLYTIPSPTQDQTIKVTGVVKGASNVFTMTLTPGEGYTLTGAATAEFDTDYTFSLSVAEGYYKSAAFAVKADDKALTANEDGTYTVAKVAANVTITVEGVQKKPENGLSAVKFTVSSGSTARAYDITPAFDPAVKEYTILAPDSDTALYAWATMSKGMSSKGTIKAEWVSLTGSTSSTKTQAIKSGGTYGQSLSGVVIAGDKTCTVTLKIEDGAYTDSYTFTTVRTDPTLKSLELVNVALNKTFSSATKNYTATTADESVTVKLEPKGSSYTVTINGKTDKTVALEMGENVIEIVVQNARGEKNTYTVTVTRVQPVTVTLDMNPANAKVTLTDAKGKKIEPDSTGAYHLMSGSTYYYAATASGYKRTTGSFTPTVSGPVSIALDKDTAQPVTVYFSFSHDEKFEFCDETGEVMALKKITVPYFDLANYGMEDFYFSSESYGSVDPENPGAGSDLEPGTAEFAYGKITMLHLFIYATEVYRCGIDPADAGQGYLLDSGLLGQDIFSYSGSVGSIFLNTIWNYDLNLNYYLNHEYPLASGGWGSTCDQILLHDDDVVTLGHFTDWSFFNDSTSVFNHFESDTAAPVQGDQFTLSVIRDGADMYGTYNTAHTPVTYNPDIYCARVAEIYDGDVTTWTYVGTADDEGRLVVDTTDLAPGEYVFAMAGQPGAENPDAICSTPGGMRITIQAKPVIKGDVDGDGTVDAMDVTALYNALTTGSALDAAVSDINGDGVVDVFDVMALYASIAGGK